MLFSALLSLRELSFASSLPVILPGQEPEWLLRNAAQRRELKALSAERRRQPNTADRAERGWLARFRLARD